MPIFLWDVESSPNYTEKLIFVGIGTITLVGSQVQVVPSQPRHRRCSECQIEPMRGDALRYYSMQCSEPLLIYLGLHSYQSLTLVLTRFASIAATALVLWGFRYLALIGGSFSTHKC
jgi:hypothetical protein